MNAEQVNRENAEKPICPECGADARRPKCLFELGSYCPRHDALAEWKLKQAALAAKEE